MHFDLVIKWIHEEMKINISVLIEYAENTPSQEYILYHV